MKNLFSYDSKFSQTVIMLADYVILNVLFLLCCIPVFTVGAAQAGLYSGIAALNNKEDDTSCVRKFFQGFSNGFGSITILWSISLGIMALLVYNLTSVLILDAAGVYAPVWLCVIVLAVFIVYQSVMVIFHARFGCTMGQLVKNVLYVILSHPLRSIAVAILTWLPVILCAVAFDVFVKDLLLIALCYYSVAFLMNLSIMKKPFRTLEDNYYKSIAPQETDENETSEDAGNET